MCVCVCIHIVAHYEVWLYGTEGKKNKKNKKNALIDKGYSSGDASRTENNNNKKPIIIIITTTTTIIIMGT